MAINMHSNEVDERFEGHNSLWLADGNIVLAATSSSDIHLSILFRVHKSILSRQSQFFSDMFAFPENSLYHTGDEHDILEGLPLVRMHGDSVEDIEALLKYLYDPM